MRAIQRQDVKTAPFPTPGKSAAPIETRTSASDTRECAPPATLLPARLYSAQSPCGAPGLCTETTNKTDVLVQLGGFLCSLQVLVFSSPWLKGFG